MMITKVYAKTHRSKKDCNIVYIICAFSGFYK